MADDEFWEPFIPNFSHLFHPISIATMVLNTSSNPHLPDHLWRYVFSFIQRKDFLPTPQELAQAKEVVCILCLIIFPCVYLNVFNVK